MHFVCKCFNTHGCRENANPNLGGFCNTHWQFLPESAQQAIVAARKRGLAQEVREVQAALEWLKTNVE